MASITLSDGRTIALFRLYQRYAYEGMAGAAPTDERNTALCEEAVAHARARSWVSAGAPVVLLRPRVRRDPAQFTPDFARQYQRMTGSSIAPPLYVPRLPAVICFGAFSSDPLAQRPDELASRLCIVWFQDEFALPIEPAIEREISGVAWERLAGGYQP